MNETIRVRPLKKMKKNTAPTDRADAVFFFIPVSSRSSCGAFILSVSEFLLRSPDPLSDPSLHRILR